MGDITCSMMYFSLYLQKHFCFYTETSKGHKSLISIKSEKNFGNRNVLVPFPNMLLLKRPYFSITNDLILEIKFYCWFSDEVN